MDPKELEARMAALKSMSGQIEPGNIDLLHRPKVRNPDGSISTVRSIGVNVDGNEVLLPTVSEDGRIMSNEEAVKQYRQTGRHLGKFSDVESSNKYAKSLHEQQEAALQELADPDVERIKRQAAQPDELAQPQQQIIDRQVLEDAAALGGYRGQLALTQLLLAALRAFNFVWNQIPQYSPNVLKGDINEPERT